MSYRNHRELDVWKVSIDLVKATYEVISALPNEEKYALGQQLRRCAVSIPSNIAEGQGRGSAQEIRQFSRLARGYLSELDTQLYLCKDLCGIDTSATDELIDRVSRMLSNSFCPFARRTRPTQQPNSRLTALSRSPLAAVGSRQSNLRGRAS